MGMSDLKNIRQGKYFEIEIEERVIKIKQKKS